MQSPISQHHHMRRRRKSSRVSIYHIISPVIWQPTTHSFLFVSVCFLMAYTYLAVYQVTDKARCESYPGVHDGRSARASLQELSTLVLEGITQSKPQTLFEAASHRSLFINCNNLSLPLSLSLLLSLCLSLSLSLSLSLCVFAVAVYCG
jgi:hypothetical protein